jgi:hypothetical protein
MDRLASVSLIAIGVILWVVLGWGWMPLPPVLGYDKLQVPAVILPGAGILVGVGLALFVTGARAPTSDKSQPGRPVPWNLLALLFCIVLIGVVVLLLSAIQAGEMKAPRAALFLVFSGLTLLVAYYALEAIRLGDGLAFDTHWGGLGGGLGGFRISSAAGLTLLMLVLVGVTAAVGLYEPPAAAPHDASGAGASAATRAPGTIRPTATPVAK